MSRIRSLSLALLGSTMLTSVASAQQGDAGGDIGTVDVTIAGAPAAQPTTSTSTDTSSIPSILPSSAVGVQDKTTGNATVTRAGLDQQAPTANVAQQIKYVPGVTVIAADPSGIIKGGGYAIRGFDSSQTLFTRNGIYQNDPSTGALTPQVYVDAENICGIAVSEGGHDAGPASGLGAVGGTVAVTTCAPLAVPTFAFEQTIGSFATSKEFGRLDTGKIGDGLTSYISFSNSHVDEFVGSGEGFRRHIDAGAEYNISTGNKITLDAWYDNFDTVNQFEPSLAQYNKYGFSGSGYGYHFNGPTLGAPAVISALTPNKSAVTTDPMQRYIASEFHAPGVYYSASLTGEFTPADHVKLTVQPYYWYQAAGASNSLTAYNLTNGVGTGFVPGVGNRPIGVVNGSGLSALVSSYNASVIKRGGVNSSVAWTLDHQVITAGANFDLVHQQQTNPFEQFNTDGSVPNPYFDDRTAKLIGTDGQEINARNWTTNLQTLNPYLSDHVKLFDDRINIDAAIQFPISNRTFTNYPNASTTGYEFYTVARHFLGVLPSGGISYALDRNNQIFTGVSTGQKLPGNYVDQNLVNPANGRILTPVNVKAEKSVTVDAGYRYTTEKIGVSGTLYYIKYSDRIDQITATDGSNVFSFVNVGSTTTKGAELAFTTHLTEDLHTFVTASYNDSRIDNDITASDSPTVFKTTGKVYYNSPKYIASAGLTYDVGAATFGISTKYTSYVFSTLTNDQSIPGFDTVDLSFAYKLKSLDIINPLTKYTKDPVLRVNVSNLFNTHYLSLNGSVIGPQTTAAANPIYFLGSPLYVTASISTKF